MQCGDVDERGYRQESDKDTIFILWAQKEKKISFSVDHLISIFSADYCRFTSWIVTF